MGFCVGKGSWGSNFGGEIHFVSSLKSPWTLHKQLFHDHEKGLLNVFPKSCQISPIESSELWVDLAATTQFIKKAMASDYTITRVSSKTPSQEEEDLPGS